MQRGSFADLQKVAKELSTNIPFYNIKSFVFISLFQCQVFNEFFCTFYVFAHLAQSANVSYCGTGLSVVVRASVRPCVRPASTLCF